MSETGADLADVLAFEPACPAPGGCPYPLRQDAGSPAMLRGTPPGRCCCTPRAAIYPVRAYSWPPAGTIGCVGVAAPRQGKTSAPPSPRAHPKSSGTLALATATLTGRPMNRSTAAPDTDWRRYAMFSRPG